MSDTTAGRITFNPTPGPWEARYLAPNFVEVISKRRGHKPPVIHWQGFDESDVPAGEHEANARLIAAAPDLLAALKALLADIELGLLVRDITRDGEPAWSAHMLAFVQRLQAAQTVIAKAEGR